MTAVELSGEQSGGKDEEVKLLEMFLARCQKSFGELEFVVALSMDKRIFGKSKNRFGTISGRNI